MVRKFKEKAPSKAWVRQQPRLMMGPTAAAKARAQANARDVAAAMKEAAKKARERKADEEGAMETVKKMAREADEEGAREGIESVALRAEEEAAEARRNSIGAAEASGVSPIVMQSLSPVAGSEGEEPAAAPTPLTAPKNTEELIDFYRSLDRKFKQVTNQINEGTPPRDRTSIRKSFIETIRHLSYQEAAVNPDSEVEQAGDMCFLTSVVTLLLHFPLYRTKYADQLADARNIYVEMVKDDITPPPMITETAIPGATAIQSPTLKIAHDSAHTTLMYMLHKLTTNPLEEVSIMKTITAPEKGDQRENVVIVVDKRYKGHNMHEFISQLRSALKNSNHICPGFIVYVSNPPHFVACNFDKDGNHQYRDTGRVLIGNKIGNAPDILYIVVWYCNPNESFSWDYPRKL